MIASDDIIIAMANFPGIQELWEPKLGDLCWHPKHVRGDGKVGLVVSSHGFTVYIYDGGKSSSNPREVLEMRSVEPFRKEKCIWIPSQEQLQDMLGKPVGNLPQAFYSFTQTEYYQGNTPIGMFGSMLQLWLAFVMRERFGKIWDGEKWVDVSEGGK